MKTLSITLCCILSVITVGAIVFSVRSSNQTEKVRHQWIAESNANKEKLGEYSEITESNQQVIADLEMRAIQLTAFTNQLNAQLAAANEKIQDYETAEQNRLAVEEENKLVPPPTIANNVFFFSKVVSVHNAVLATNATFAYITGRRLIFRQENQEAIAFDVDEIHPLILQYLGIDPDAAKATQQQRDASWAEQRRIGAIIFAQSQKDMEARRERETALAIAQQKADAAAQAAVAAQQQAQAEKEQADAAIINANKPAQPTQVIVQQGQQQQYVAPNSGNIYWSH